jgi:plastocyanin
MEAGLNGPPSVPLALKSVAGQYRYVCLPHEASNMFGTINVS